MAKLPSVLEGRAQEGRLSFPGTSRDWGPRGGEIDSQLFQPGSVVRVLLTVGWGQDFSPHPPHALSSLVTDVNSRSARVLFLLVVPGHLVFLYTISCMQGGHTTLTLIFIIFYMTAALLQVWPSKSRSTGKGQGCPAWIGKVAQFGPIRPLLLWLWVADKY